MLALPRGCRIEGEGFGVGDSRIGRGGDGLAPPPLRSDLFDVWWMAIVPLGAWRPAATECPDYGLRVAWLEGEGAGEGAFEFEEGLLHGEAAAEAVE